MEAKEFREKVMAGFKLAVDNMIVQAKKDDREVVFSRDGQVVHVKARDLK